MLRAVASLGKTAFFNISASSLVSHYGESEKLVRTLFALARHHAPSVVFFDEVDALVSTRGMAGEHEASRRLKSELLMQMDGVGSSAASAGTSAKDSMVMVLATSNKPWDLDEAMRRRLERRIYIPLPDEGARKQMLQIHREGVKLGGDVSLEHLARLTEGYSGATCTSPCDASMMPMRRQVEEEPWQIVELHESGALEGEVSLPGEALASTRPSVAPSSRRMRCGTRSTACRAAARARARRGWGSPRHARGATHDGEEADLLTFEAGTPMPQYPRMGGGAAGGTPATHYR